MLDFSSLVSLAAETASVLAKMTLMDRIASIKPWDKKSCLLQDSKCLNEQFGDVFATRCVGLAAMVSATLDATSQHF